MTESTEAKSDSVEEESKRYCWVCFITEEEDKTSAWVQPCRCHGTTKWVHQNCLQRWIDEKQRGDNTAKVTCPQCGTEYFIILPPFGKLAHMMDLADRMLYKVCPFVTAGVVVGSIYWTAVTYGAVTVMQVLGHKEGLNIMEEADPLLLLVGLPTIPVMLILAKMVRWEDYILHMWRRHSCRIPGLKKLLSDVSSITGFSERFPVSYSALSDPVSTTRILCGALMLPTVATVLGRTLFINVKSNLQKSLLGGASFLVVKGAFKIYLKQQQFLRQCRRRILNYGEIPDSYEQENSNPNSNS